MSECIECGATGNSMTVDCCDECVGTFFEGGK